MIRASFSRTNHISSESWQRLAAFRGVAALCVAFGHLVQVFIDPISLEYSRFSGLLAAASVMVFFVVSGFCIADSFNRALSTDSPGVVYFSNRVARIYPPLIFSILFILGLGLLAPLCFATGESRFYPAEHLARVGFLFDWTEALGALVFLNGFVFPTPDSNGPLWSLSYEVWLYVVYFFLAATFTHNKMSAIVAVVLYILLCLFDKNHLFAKYSLVWFWGVLVWFFVRNNWIISFPKAKLVLISILIVSLSFGAYKAYLFMVSDVAQDISIFGISAGLAFGTYLCLAKARSGAPRLLLESSKFGYTLYLLHFPIYLFCFGVAQTVVSRDITVAWFVGLSALIFSVSLSFLLARFLENRALYLPRKA